MSSSKTLLAYLAPDRRQAISLGGELPSQTWGAALLTDMFGFTALTETLARNLGPRRGAEQLGQYLDQFYAALIEPVDRYGGSVIGFSGDAITCWFEADDGRRAVAAAQAMQIAIKPFASLQLSSGESVFSLGIKTAIASGPVRRLRVGDPDIQYLDTLAGSTMERLSAIVNLAGIGELVLDENTETQLHKMAKISAWRTSAATGYRAALLSSLDVPIEPSPQVSPLPALTEEQIRPWLLPTVFARLQAGQGEFLTELRPAMALFMRFDGLDYDGDDDQVGDKLDALIRLAQSVLAQYGGALLQLTIGDKGSYIYAAFGAPVAHEDDAVRAVDAALELRLLPGKVDGIHSVSIGLSRGVMRTGAYGSTTRRTYGVLGDDVNLAARLMERAAPGQVLVSEAIWQATSTFNWQALPALEVKGKRAAVKPAALLGRQEPRTFATYATLSAFPMVGRQTELALVDERLELARRGQGQIVSITGEAGMGKSRLLAEALQRAGAGGLTYYGGECQSYGTQSMYLVWQSIWQGFFGFDPARPPAEQIETLEKALARINPDLLLRMPLLGTVLNLSIPDNGLTGEMDARSRKTLREALLVDCLRAWAGQRPLVLVLEDAHWIDPLSRDLLALIGRAIRELPVLILLAYRQPAENETAAFLPGLANIEHATEMRLAEFTRAETEQLVAARLAHFGLEGGAPPALVERMSARAQGNPFYVEELLNYLHGRGLDPREEAVWEQADLPDSLHSLILSRIDQLSERQQITIKAASIIGRLFRAAWLYEYYPPLGGPSQVSADLEILSRLEFTVLETPEPQLAYLFKHVITQEVAYESLAYATRASLHEQFARYLELTSGDDAQPFLDLLAYHYERSQNLAKKREYLRKAGEAAQKAYANEAALSYLGRALALEMDYAEQFAILLTREKVLDILGKREDQNQDLTALSTLAEALDDNGRRARAAWRWSIYALETSNYPAAILAAQQTVAWANLAGADEDKVRGYISWGQALWFQGNYAEARLQIEQALALAQMIQHTNLIASSLIGLGGLEARQGNYDSAATHMEHALQLQRKAGNLPGEAIYLYNLGSIAYNCGDLAKAENYYEQALHIFRVIGNRRDEGDALNDLGNLIAEQRGDYAKAKLYCEQGLRLLQEVGDRSGEMRCLYNLYTIELAQNNYGAAKNYTEQALSISREIGVKYYEGGCLRQLGNISNELGEYTSALGYYEQGLFVLREIGDGNLIGGVLTALGMVFYHSGKHKMALEKTQQALLIAIETKRKLEQTRALLSQGHIFRELSDWDQAADSYQQTLDLALELDLHHYAKPAQTGLAAVALALGNLTQAQSLVNEILNYLETASLSTVDEIFWIYLTCYRILQANTDPRAWATLNAAHSLLQEIAAKIDDETLRASFLQNVRSNREIVRAWESLTAPD